MKTHRRCVHFGCVDKAVAALTYNYAEATAVLGPLPPQPVPYTSEYCARHAMSFTAPQGWQVIRLSFDTQGGVEETPDLQGLVAAMRQAAARVRQEISEGGISN